MSYSTILNMDPHFTNEIHNSARKYYRFACLRVARYLSYIGKSLEPYATQNAILTLVSPTNDKEVVIHLSKEHQSYCPIYKFTSVDGLYVAHVGQIQKELIGVKRFYSFLRHTVKLDSSENHLPNIVALKAVAHKVELNYVDPLKEFLNVVYDKENEEFTEIFVETEYIPESSEEPTFEDVMTLWIAVVIWCARLLTSRILYKKSAHKITGKIYKLIQHKTVDNI
ncbi:putative swi5-like protein [Gigaspora margarita]|uniref:Putative swi5-like protein n=1 Tax=Gigaspora margarita TaxID=4874 RepID=A0A8H4A8F6_GIGMA|nr:putative swi5-like protein [Gigaspora margarita]